MRRINLPDSFEARFIVGRSLFLVPVFSVLLTLFFRMDSPWRVLIAIKYVVVLAIALWMAVEKAPEERQSIERYYEGYMRDGFWSRTDILPISAAVLLVGMVMGLVRMDWRWIPVALILGALMWLGLVLRWLIYDRWVNKQLRLYQAG